MASKQTHPRISLAQIKELARLANELTNKPKPNHIAASLLLWSAYEALIHRACVKALWLRDCNVNDAEIFVSSYDLRAKNLWSFFAECCGVNPRRHLSAVALLYS
jgi:hypothetical protein